jgi:hypothetical protein
MYLSDIQYNALMIAINNAKDIDLLDPYAENPDGYTEEQMQYALRTAEQKLINLYVNQK